MRRPFLVPTLLLVAWSGPSVPGVAADNTETQVVVAFNGSIPLDVEAQLAARGAQLHRRDDILHFVVATTTNPAALLAWSNVTDPQVRFTEIPGTILLPPPHHAEATPSTEAGTEYPNDPLYWRKPGPTYHQWGPRMIDAKGAWNVTKGSQNVIVAVLDTGVDYTHPDLTANIARRVDGSVLGIDLRDADTDPMDFIGHGTMVAGIIGAQSHNSLGIAGMAQVRIMPVRIMDGVTTVPYDSAAAATAIGWASVNGARIITAAFAVIGNDLTVRLAVEHAARLGATIVAGAGNADGGPVNRPGAYPEVITVSGLAANGAIAGYSSVGPEVDVAAPGGSGGAREDDVLSLAPEGRYRFAFGTSYAVGFVAGTAALALSANPLLSASQLRGCLLNTAADLGTSGPDPQYGHGRLDAKRAVEAAASLPGGGAPSGAGVQSP